MMDLEGMDLKTELDMNAKLQRKKNNLRKALAKKGMLKREGDNNFDKYKYFSEAQYKLLFTELFSEAGLELKFTEASYQECEGTEKQRFGRRIKLIFTLMDTETGYGEESVITGEAFDKGDKAGYKAYTGAYKYYLASTFGVATGDDPEKPDKEVQAQPQTAAQKPTQSAAQKQTKVQASGVKATPNQIAILKRVYTGENMTKLLKKCGVENVEDIPAAKASDLITKLEEKQNGKETK